MKFEVHEPHFTLLEPNYYKALITKTSVVKNNFYNEDDPTSGFPEQIEVEFSIDNPENPEGQNIFLKKWFSPVLTKKSNLTKLCKAVNPAFDSANPGELDTDMFMGKYIRVNVIQKEDSKGILRNRISDLIKE